MNSIGTIIRLNQEIIEDIRDLLNFYQNERQNAQQQVEFLSQNEFLNDLSDTAGRIAYDRLCNEIYYYRERKRYIDQRIRFCTEKKNELEDMNSQLAAI